MVVDWRRLEEIPAGERVRRPYEESDQVEDLDAGWFWPAGDPRPWWGVYESRGTAAGLGEVAIEADRRGWGVIGLRC
ncbi:hypothetical protein [Streptomyces lasiicapitis]|nr:hypothetical protein [Streptomyces lasiicapitis]